MFISRFGFVLDYYCDLVPRESLTDSPPSEFNLSEDENDDRTLPQPMNFIEHAPSSIAKPLPVKYGSDKYLIDAFANTVLHILEIKCSDPHVCSFCLSFTHRLFIFMIVPFS